MNIRPIRNEQDHKTVHECAAVDGHKLIWPTHTIMKDERIVGSLSIMPMVLVWLDKTTKARDTQEVRNIYEANLSNSNRFICVPCMDNSPLFSFMPKFGYFDAGKINLFFKGL